MKTESFQSYTQESIKHKLYESLQQTSSFMPDVPFRKYANSEGLHHDHAAKFNSAVHDHLKSLGFKQQGASETVGSKVVTTYKHPESNVIAEHHKGSKSSKLIVMQAD